MLGYRTCSSFGSWSEKTLLPPTTLQIATTSRLIYLPPVAASGTTELEDSSLRFQADRALPGSMSTLGLALRVAMDIGGDLYIGADGEVGSALRAADVRAISDSVDPIVARQDQYAQLGLFVGAHHPVGWFQLAAELSGGVQMIPVIARYVDDQEMGFQHETSLDTLIRPAIESRVRVTRWLSPWISLGAFGGAQLAIGSSSRGYVGGLQLGLHLRAFDGGL